MQQYHCEIVFGNDSKVETQSIRERIISFLKCFYVSDYTIQQIDTDKPFHLVEITMNYHSEIKRIHFAQSLLSFCLYHKLAFYELA